MKSFIEGCFILENDYRKIPDLKNWQKHVKQDVRTVDDYFKS